MLRVFKILCRELASQIFEVLVNLLNNIPENILTCELYIGGGWKKSERNNLDLDKKPANIIVGTPGKLRELTDLKDFLNLKTLEILIMGLKLFFSLFISSFIR